MQTNFTAGKGIGATMEQEHSLPSFVLITPARNEEKFIERLLQAVASQTILPTKWVIVNDGSTDATARIVSSYVAKYAWIELINLPSQRDRSFAAKVFAVNAGLERVRNLDYQVIGNLDSDVSFDPDYFEFLMKKFQGDPILGVAGTIFQEEGYSSGRDSFEGQNHVAGGCQLFRRRCFEEIGGYVPNRAGGVDWIAVTTARMKGWKTRSFREKSFFHYRSLGTAERSLLAAAFSYGEKDYYLGGHPLWEAFRVAYRMTKRPYLLGGMALFSGYVFAFLRRAERPVSNDLMRFHRKEQMMKLKAIVKSLATFKKIDSFEIRPT
jgi:glycosyltransferase involved in cell wall biosynthesis